MSAEVSGPIQVNPNMGPLAILWLSQVDFSLDSGELMLRIHTDSLFWPWTPGKKMVGDRSTPFCSLEGFCPVQQCHQGEEPFILNLPTNLILWDWSNVSLSLRLCPQRCLSFAPCLSPHPNHKAYMGCSQGCVENVIYHLTLSKQEKSCCLCFCILLVQDVTQSLVLFPTSSAWKQFLHSGVHTLLFFDTLVHRKMPGMQESLLQYLASKLINEWIS